VLLEGMALGKPVISTRVSGTPELVREGVDGLLVDPADVRGLAEAYHVLGDASTRRQMGRAGEQRVRERFSLARQAREFAGVLDAIATQRQAA
jgi:glycosyltransferase involved in cell wall biosynthesis